MTGSADLGLQAWGLEPSNYALDVWVCFWICIGRSSMLCRYGNCSGWLGGPGGPIPGQGRGVRRGPGGPPNPKEYILS